MPLESDHTGKPDTETASAAARFNYVRYFAVRCRMAEMMTMDLSGVGFSLKELGVRCRNVGNFARD